MGYDCTVVHQEKPKSSSGLWLIFLGSLLSSATWGGFLYGPQAYEDFNKWYNAPPQLSDIGEKISSMLDEEKAWTLLNDSRDDEIVYESKGVKKVSCWFRTSDKSYIYMFEEKKRPASKQEITDFLNQKENKYISGKVKNIVDKLKAVKKQQKANELLEKFN